MTDKRIASIGEHLVLGYGAIRKVVPEEIVSQNYKVVIDRGPSVAIPQVLCNY